MGRQSHGGARPLVYLPTHVMYHPRLPRFTEFPAPARPAQLTLAIIKKRRNREGRLPKRHNMVCFSRSHYGLQIYQSSYRLTRRRKRRRAVLATLYGKLCVDKIPLQKRSKNLESKHLKVWRLLNSITQWAHPCHLYI